MPTTDELATAWVSDRGLTATPDTLAMALRRVLAWGPLAQTALVHMPPPVKVRVLEHGRDLVDAGCVLAEVWIDAADAEQLQRLAGELHRVVRDRVWSQDLMLVLAVHRARWWHRVGL